MSTQEHVKISGGVPQEQPPRTIEELKQWYKDNGFPPEDVTRFFIGTDYKGRRAFGIYEENGIFTVYKNKDDGTRAIRYKGKDEAHAVNELCLRLLQEVKNQHRHGHSDVPWPQLHQTQPADRDARPDTKPADDKTVFESTAPVTQHPDTSTQSQNQNNDADNSTLSDAEIRRLEAMGIYVKNGKFCVDRKREDGVIWSHKTFDTENKAREYVRELNRMKRQREEEDRIYKQERIKKVLIAILVIIFICFACFTGIFENGESGNGWFVDKLSDSNSDSGWDSGWDSGDTDFSSDW